EHRRGHGLPRGLDAETARHGDGEAVPGRLAGTARVPRAEAVGGGDADEGARGGAGEGGLDAALVVEAERGGFSVEEQAAEARGEVAAAVAVEALDAHHVHLWAGGGEDEELSGALAAGVGAPRVGRVELVVGAGLGAGEDEVRRDVDEDGA